MQAVRACPVCRQVTHYVTPSLVWPADEDEKEAIMGAYKNKLGSIDCRFFDFGSGTCPFSTSCMYRHAYKNGQLEVRPCMYRMPCLCCHTNKEGQLRQASSNATC